MISDTFSFVNSSRFFGRLFCIERWDAYWCGCRAPDAADPAELALRERGTAKLFNYLSPLQLIESAGFGIQIIIHKKRPPILFLYAVSVPNRIEGHNLSGI